MNESLKKLSSEIGAEISAILKAAPMQDFMSRTKQATAEDSGTFEVVVSTADMDRQGESVDQNGWDLSLFKMNPVVLFGHDYYSLPIGICDSIELIDGKLVAKGRFAPMDANPFAQQVRKLYDLNILRATSVGFIVREAQGRVITKAELIEFSFVPVPANPYALSMRDVQTLGLDLGMLTAKGLELKAEGEEPAPEPQPEATPTPETPAEPAQDHAGEEETPKPDADTVPEPETPAEAENSEKGAVSESLNGMSDDVYIAKWNNLDRVLPVMDAFISAYLHPSTKVEDFDALLTECVALLTGSNESKALKAALEARAKGEGKSYIASRKSVKNVEAIGAAMAAMQAAIDDSIVTTSKTVLEIVATEYGEDEAKAIAEKLLKSIKENVSVGSQDAEGDAGEENRKNGSPSQRSNAEIATADALKMWIEQRDILRAIATATTRSLERVNTRIREDRGF